MQKTTRFLHATEGWLDSMNLLNTSARLSCMLVCRARDAGPDLYALRDLCVPSSAHSEYTEIGEPSVSTNNSQLCAAIICTEGDITAHGNAIL